MNGKGKQLVNRNICTCETDLYIYLHHVDDWIGNECWSDTLESGLCSNPVEFNPELFEKRMTVWVSY